MNILFSCPIFYNYQKEIISSLKKQNHHIVFLPEKRINGLLRQLLKLFPTLANYLIHREEKTALKKIKDIKIDLFFLIRGGNISESFILKLKKNNPDIYFLAYQWDSMHNNPNFLGIKKYFNKIYSFDFFDCKQYSFNYLHLFYDSIFQHAVKKKDPFIYDYIFIGSFTKERYFELKYFRKLFKELNLKFKFILVADPVEYIGFVMRTKDISLPVNFLGVGRKKLLSLYTRSKLILDIPSSNQSGYTMRTIESLALGKKIITTNDTSVTCKSFAKNIFDFNQHNDKKALLFDSLNERNDGVGLNDLLSIDEWLHILFSDLSKTEH